MSDDDHGFDLSEGSQAFDWGEEEDSEGAEPDVLRFDLGGMSFAVEATHVAEVGTPPALTLVPGLPDHVVGVAVQRRHVLSIVDLAVFLGLRKTVTEAPRLVVFDVQGIQAGVVVSGITALEVWPEDDESPPIDDLDDRIRRFVISARWAPGGRVLLLDIPELLRAAAVR